MTSAFTSAAWAFARLVRDIPESAWSGPGLGEWDLRALVGHTSRSLVTVSTYLKTPCEHQDVDSPAAYYAAIRPIMAAGGTEIVERGRQAGRDLGVDPAATVEHVVQRALADVADAGDPLVAVINGLGIRLYDYLPTRIFELAVHSLDIARATGLDYHPPADVLAATIALATQIATATGDGETVLLALTGRGNLPPGYSVV